MTNGFDLLVFDWDGTLMDSQAQIVACMQAAAEDLDCDVPEHDAVRDIIGLGLPEAVTVLFPALDAGARRAMAERYRLHFLASERAPSELFPGAAETLLALGAQGYLLAVATGKGRRGLDKALGSTGLGKVFHASRCADETFSKPHPEMLHQLMRELGVEPSATLMIGDTEYDLQMARNAGVSALAVGYGVHEPNRLARHGPLACLGEIQELLPWLDRVGAERAILG
jgi:phosphoglycolate phosphatase